VLKYNIYRNTQQIDNVLPTVFEYSDNNLNNDTYQYQVSATYNGCESGLTDVIPVTINYTNINNPLQTLYVLYPNPANNVVFIKGDDIRQIEIYDLQGRTVKTQLISSIQDGSATINISTLASGMYLVKIYSKTDKAEIKRLIVIK